jgi:endoribonuclease Dicer
MLLTESCLGDAFLKYLSSVYVFVTNPAQHEGALHVSRQRIISNKSLLHNANQAGLSQYIQSKPFTLRLWQPTNFSVLPFPQANSRPDAVNEGDKEGENGLDEGDASKILYPGDAGECLSQAPAQGRPLPSDEVSTAPSLEEVAQPVDGSQPKKKSKKQRQLEELNSQMLGDKVG